MLFERITRIKAFVFGLDGVFSGSNILISEEGHRLRSFNMKDGYAVQRAVKKGFPVAVITNDPPPRTEMQISALGITDVFYDKKAGLPNWLSDNQLTLADILYMGADIPDLENMKTAGFPACPADAAEEIKVVSSYISAKNGGAGAVRDVIEKVIKLQGKWAGV